MRQIAHRWGGAVLNLLLPPQCLTCDAPVGAPGQFCAPCFQQARFITAPFCRQCGLPFGHAFQFGAAGLCPHCQAEPPPWTAARAALVYDAHSRKLLLALKHADRTDLAHALAAMMARAGVDLLRQADLLVPVPLHPSRLRARGYNQAALLARALGGIGGVPLSVDALVRLRPTPPLGELSAEQRSAVVSGGFAVRRGRGAALQGRRVLLVDDVLTSGATCAACTRTMLQAGVAQVDVLVAARVPDPRMR